MPLKTDKQRFLVLIGLISIIGGGIAILQNPPWTRPAKMNHDAIEYVMKPGTTRVGFARTTINDLHMRTDDDPPYDALILGDSVVLGWARIDQSDIFPALVADRLGVRVGNVSANSWGPENLAAYIKSFGLFDARVVVFVFNGDDAYERGTPITPASEPSQIALNHVADMVDAVRVAGAEPVGVLWPFLTNDHAAGRVAIGDVLRDRGVVVLEPQNDASDYFDGKHPSPAGHGRLAEDLMPLIEPGLNK